MTEFQVIHRIFPSVFSMLSTVNFHAAVLFSWQMRSQMTRYRYRKGSFEAERTRRPPNGEAAQERSQDRTGKVETEGRPANQKVPRNQLVSRLQTGFRGAKVSASWQSSGGVLRSQSILSRTPFRGCRVQEDVRGARKGALRRPRLST